MVKASVVIPTFGRPQYLVETVVSVAAQQIEGEFEVIVVDNKADGSAREALSEVADNSHGRVVVIEEPRLGLHNARHSGARRARGELVVYVDDDVLVPPGWLSAYIDVFRDSSVGLAGGKVLPKWEANPPEWYSDFSDAYLSLLDLGDERKTLSGVGYIHGCNMALPRHVLFEVGGFNPDSMGVPGFNWQRGDGEMGLHRRVLEGGFVAVYEPKAWLFHRIPASRLTEQSFIKRGTLIGLTLSYIDLRSYRERRLFLPRSVYRMARALLNFITQSILSRFGREHRIRRRSDAALFFAYARHHLVGLVNPRKRQWIFRDSYL